jgi:hypothetical protein
MVTGGDAARLSCACEVALTRDSLDSRCAAAPLRKNDKRQVRGHVLDDKGRRGGHVLDDKGRRGG